MTITALSISGGTVRYAGLHLDLIIYRAASKQVERIETQGVWLGIADGNISEFLQDAELTLEPGDMLLLYTDGYTEAAIGGRPMETEHLVSNFAELARQSLPPNAVIEGLLGALKDAVVHDDVTLVALRRMSTTKENS
jgi:sigma-B regulation protein RsbU (phosphoserine phosphatase)